MKDDISSQLAAVFDLACQPVFFLQDGSVTYRNSAAAQLVQEGEQLFPDGMPEQVTELTLMLAGLQYQATLKPEDGFTVCLVGRCLNDTGLEAGYLSLVAARIRTPLGELFSAARVLSEPVEELPPDEPLMQAACQLNRGLYRLFRLTGQLSDGGQLFQGQQSLCPERTELRAYLSELGSSADELLRYTGAALQLTNLTHEIYAEIDRQKLERAIWNLLANAVRYSSEGGKVELCATAAHGKLVLSVTDHGGRPPFFPERPMFDRFAAPAALAAADEGLGFGLVIVRQIALLHGGTAVSSREADGGMTVTLSVPLHQRGPQAHARTAAYDYAGGRNHALVELSDILPSYVYHPLDL